MLDYDSQNSILLDRDYVLSSYEKKDKERVFDLLESSIAFRLEKRKLIVLLEELELEGGSDDDDEDRSRMNRDAS